MWSGAISFGLVNVPVKLYSAVSRKTVRFHQLNKDTGTRIAQKRVDAAERRGGSVREPRQGLRADEGALRRHHARGARGARSREEPDDRHRGLRRPRRHRPRLLRPSLLPDPGQGLREGLRAAAERDGGVRQGGDRARRAAVEGAAGRDPARARQRADDGDDDLRRRGRPARPDRRPARGRRPQGLRARAEDGPAADRLALLGLRAREVPRRVPREGARADRAQGGRRGDRRPARGAAAGQGPGPDGGARGEPRRGQGRRRGRARSPPGSRRARRSRPRPRRRGRARTRRASARCARRPSGPTARARGRGPSRTGGRGPDTARRARSRGRGR